MAILDRFRTVLATNIPIPRFDLRTSRSCRSTIASSWPQSLAATTTRRCGRAAVAKLLDPPALAGVAREDRDEGVRDQAIAMLRDIALEASRA